MYVMIDNFDSFVYNLKAYFQELGREILVRRCDEITLEAVSYTHLDGYKRQSTEWGIGYVSPFDAPPHGQDAKSHCDGICLNSSVWLRCV